VFICEDNEPQRLKITECIEKYIMIEDLNMEIVLSTHDPDILLSHLKRNSNVGLYFLDVDLRHNLNGIQLAEAIRKYDPRGFIVFITTHGEMLPMTFKYKVEAMDFIVKDDIGGIESKIVACIKNAFSKFTARSTTLQANYVFKIAEQKVISVPYDKILYIETSSQSPRKVILYTTESMFEYYGKLDDIQKQLDERFYRCHKSFIVNVQAVECIDKKEHVVYLKGGYKCFVATRRIKTLLRLFNEQ